MTLILLLIIWVLLIIIFNNIETFSDECSNPMCLNMDLREGCANSECKNCKYCEAYLGQLNFKCSTSCRNLSLSNGCIKHKCKNCNYCKDFLKQISPLCRNIKIDEEYNKHVNNKNGKKLNKDELIQCLTEWQKIIHVNEILHNK